jgi:hypothetical protein
MRRDESRDHSSKERESMCNSLVLKRTEKQACSGCKKLLAAFSVQDDKRGCREDE